MEFTYGASHLLLEILHGQSHLRVSLSEEIILLGDSEILHLKVVWLQFLI
jgi:hypothetical protein